MRFAAACLPAHELLLAAASSQQKSLVFYKRSATPEVVMNSLTPLLLGLQKLRKKKSPNLINFLPNKKFPSILLPICLCLAHACLWVVVSLLFCLCFFSWVLGSSLGFGFSACRIANSDLGFCSFPVIL